MEEEALKAQEAEQKHLADLEKVRQVELQIQQAEEKRRQEIVKEMVRFGSVC
jgi:tRNA A22 N-methylase